jgi:Second Messenger Oligonucleotide or Dinucleotide Synthetase domain
MATTAHAAFNTFRDRNALTPTQRKAIRDRKETVKGYLTADGWSVESAIFGGSHARRTKVRLPDDKKTDVDVYMVLDLGHRTNYGGLFKPPPSQLLSDIKASLDKKLRTPSVRADSPSVRIRYDDMDVDVVPAFRRGWLVGGKGFDIPYYNGWRHATPEQQRAAFSTLNGQLDNRLIHIVRMLKYWKAMHPSFPLRSYHLEVLAYNIFSQYPFTDYRNGIAVFFEHAQAYVRYQWADPGGSGSNVSDYMTPTQRDNAKSMFEAAETRARNAIAKPTWREEIDAWRSTSMFGSRFPAYTGS